MVFNLEYQDLLKKFNILKNHIQNKLNLNIGDITLKDNINLRKLYESLEYMINVLLKEKEKNKKLNNEIYNLINKNEKYEDLLQNVNQKSSNLQSILNKKEEEINSLNSKLRLNDDNLKINKYSNQIKKLEKILNTKNVEIKNLKVLINKKIDNTLTFNPILKEKNKDNCFEKITLNIINNYSEVISNLVEENNILKSKSKEYIENLIHLNNIILKVSEDNHNFNSYNPIFDKKEDWSIKTLNNLIKETKNNLFNKNFEKIMKFNSNDLILEDKEWDFQFNLNSNEKINNENIYNKITEYQNFVKLTEKNIDELAKQ